MYACMHATLSRSRSGQRKAATSNDQGLQSLSYVYVCIYNTTSAKVAASVHIIAWILQHANRRAAIKKIVVNKTAAYGRDRSLFEQLSEVSYAQLCVSPVSTRLPVLSPPLDPRWPFNMNHPIQHTLSSRDKQTRVRNIFCMAKRIVLLPEAIGVLSTYRVTSSATVPRQWIAIMLAA